MSLVAGAGSRRIYRGALLGSCAALLLATAAACGSSSSTKAASPGAVGATSAPAASTSAAAPAASDSGTATSAADLAKFTVAVNTFAAVPALPGVSGLKGKTIWYVPLGGSLPIFQAFGTGIQAALSAAGMTVHTCDGNFVPTTMAACLNQAATQGAAGVISGYIDYKLVPTAYDNLVSHHIPVLIAGEAADGGKTSTASLGFYDNSSLFNDVQKLNMESVIDDSAGKAKIVYLGVTDTTTTTASAAYAKQFVAANCPGCTFKEVDYNTASLSKVASSVSAALISNPDTNYVVDELDSGSTATIAGIQSAGFTNKVKLASTSGNLDALQRVKGGGLQFADVGYSGVFLGWQYTDGVLRMLLGKPPVPAQGVIRVFTKDNVGSLALTPAGFSSFDWYGASAYKQTFLSAWGLA